MKILYAIQGTGNGHLSRAADIISALKNYGGVDILVSGLHAEVALPYPVKYSLKGLGFFFGKHGGINILQTVRRNSTRQVLKEMAQCPVEKYDLVVNDFEPISAWACKRKNIPCVALSHQSAFLSKKVPRPKRRDAMGEWILKNYAPAQAYVGLHFESYDKNIFTPVIRSAIRQARPSDDGH
jgi:uncharacterized protein (TIGR00661 family)